MKLNEPWNIKNNNNNCDECINNYIFFNDSSAPLQNCYPKCEHLYYFNEENQYICIDFCPPEYDKLIIQKNKCIDDCKKDNEFIYEYNNNCLRKCPKNNKIDYDENKCVESCKENQFEYNDKCYNEVPNDQDNFDRKGNIYVKNTSNFDNLLNNLLNVVHLSEQWNIFNIQRDDDIVFEITNTKNELDLIKNMDDTQNKTIIDLGECEIQLREHYHINENDSLIIVKSEKKSDKVLDKNIDFNVYEPYNRSQLNLSLCDENSFNLLIPFELNIEIQQLYEQIKKLGYNMFDINEPFYQDICTPYDSSDGTDILISDRINCFYNNDNVKCQQNCKFSNYSVEFHYLKCSCSESSNNESELFERKVKLESKKMYERFYEVLKYPNVKIIKCYNILFNINTVTKNIGNILVIVCFFCYFVCLIFYIFFGLSPLKKKIKKEMKKKNIHLKSDIKKLLYPPIRRITTNNLTIRDDIKKKKTNKNKRKKN